MDFEFPIVFLTSSIISPSSWQLILFLFFIDSTCTSFSWRSCRCYLLLHVEQHPEVFRAVQGLERHFAQVADVAYAAAFSVKGTGRPRGTDQKDSKRTNSKISKHPMILNASQCPDMPRHCDRGSGKVEFQTPEAARMAVQQLDGSELDGRKIHATRISQSRLNGNDGFCCFDLLRFA